MNTNIEFTLYTRPTDVGMSLKTSHVFVASSDNHNWNCFGHGAPPDSLSQPVLTARASSKWASAIYGQVEGGDMPAAGLSLNFNGVCHTAANRVLVLAGDDIDTRKTDGDALAILMYGKFGFGLEEYIGIIKNTGQALLASDPNEITQQDIDTVVKRVAQGCTPSAELDILHIDAQEQICTVFAGTVLPDITDTQRSAFLPIYGDYQTDRATVFKDTSSSVPVGTKIAFGPLRENLGSAWLKCCNRLVAAVGIEGFKDIFGVAPEQTQALFKKTN